MKWKLGAVWGVLLTLVQWLDYLASRGGLAYAQRWVLVITVAVFAYVGYSTYRMTKSFAQAAMTAMLSGFITGLLGSLPLFFGLPSAQALFEVSVAGFATAIYGLVLGSIGSLWARMQASREVSR